MDGIIHSTESFGAVDGPGIRFVVFMRGCPLRCLYCHNPDTWAGNEGGRSISAIDLADEIMAYRNFIRNGGVTISGGEPLMQPKFCKELCDILRRREIHTAIDTSGCFAPKGDIAGAIDAADLILLDIKDIDNEDSIKISGAGNKNTFETLRYCEETKKPVWVRHVLVPGYTLRDDKLIRLRDFLSDFKCIEKIELLPYHTMGKYKWDELGLKYGLEGVDSPTEAEVSNAMKLFFGEKSE